MKSIFLTILIILFSVFGYTSELANTDTSKVEQISNKIIYPNWIKEKALKYAFVSTCLSYQTLRGFSEGYDWGRDKGHTYFINDSNSHIYGFGESLTGIGTGWLMYATIQDKNLKFYNKLGRIGGTILVGSVFTECSYKLTRYNDPFDYSIAHNKSAFVYFSFKNGKLIDSYISLGPESGPIVHGSMILLGTLLIWLN